MKSYSTLAVLISLCILLVSCEDDFAKRNLEIPIIQGPTTPFIYELPDMLISKIYYVPTHNDTSIMMAEYTYDSAYKLIRKSHFNPTTNSYNRTTEEYTYENDRLILTDNSRVIQISNSSNPYLITLTSITYSYDNLGYLISYQESSKTAAYHFIYNNLGQIALSYFDTIDINNSNNYGFLWTSYVYENGNAIKNILTGRFNDNTSRFFYDDNKRPSDGLDYVPRDRIFPFPQSNYLNPSLSKGNILNSEYDKTFLYEYNEYDYPTTISVFYSGQKIYDYEIEYITVN